jgi:heterotetrameric sarcosine oxidase gamma subunit
MSKSVRRCLLTPKEGVCVGELKAVSACAGLVPVRIGSVTVDEMDLECMTSLSPFGDALALDGALKKAHGVGWPQAGQALGDATARVVWFGRNEAVLIGPEADQGLSDVAAVVDLSDAWAAVSLEGAGTVNALARLVPVDLRAAAFGEGQTVRTQLGHLGASITKLGPERFMILVFRSMAATLIHDLKQAMAGVASRG